MRRSRFTDEQIAVALHQGEAGTPVAEICRKLGVTEATYYRWNERLESWTDEGGLVSRPEFQGEAMKSKKRHGKVSRREFVSTAGSCVAAAVGLGSAVTACGGVTPNEPQPPDPDTEVVFSSLWLTALGTSDAARRDTSNPVANGGPFGSTNANAHTVDSGSSFGWPYGNVLRIDQGQTVGGDGAVYIGKLGDQNDSPIPANTDYYFRVYVNVWDVYLNRYGSRHPCNTNHQNPYLGLFAIMDATQDKTLWRPGLVRAYTNNGVHGTGQYPGGLWWPGQYPVANSPTCHGQFWLNQQHWYLFEAHVHWLDAAQKRWFWGSYGVYDAEDNYNQLGDLSDES
jgi:hypothetical protein